MGFLINYTCAIYDIAVFLLFFVFINLYTHITRMILDGERVHFRRKQA